MKDKPIVIDREIPITSWSAGIACAAILALLIVFRDLYGALACVPGALLGWLMGVLLSPYKQEKELFEGYGKSIAAFITGFLVSKVDRIFELFMTKSGESGPALLQEANWRPLVFGFSSLLLVLLYTFTCRHYGQRAMLDRAGTPSDPSKPSNPTPGVTPALFFDS